MLGRAERLREAVESWHQPHERPLYDRTVAAVRAALGEREFAAAWDAGRTMTVDQAVATALGEVSPLASAPTDATAAR